MCPIRAGVTVNGPFSGKPSTATAVPAFAEAMGKGRRPRFAHAQHRDVVATVERDHVGGESPAGLQLDHGVALSRDDVGRGHDQIRLRHPAGAFDADSAGHPEHTHDAGRGAADADRARQARVGRRDRRGRARDRREGVDARQRIQHLRRRDELVQPLQQSRALGAATKIGLPREQQRDGPEHPHDGHARESPEDQPAGCVEGAQLPLAHPRPERRPRQGPERLEQDRADSGAGQSRQRRVRRVSSVLKELRRKPRSQPAPQDDSGQGQGARDEPLLPADEAREGDEAERDQVNFGH